MDEVNLLPCPFCRGTSAPRRDGTDWRVYCCRCGSSTGIRLGNENTKRNAIAAWNTRPTIVTDEVVERVAKALQEVDLHDGDEGNHYRLFDLLGFSGENKSVMITRQLARAAIASMPTIDQDGGGQPIESAPKDRSVILGWPIRDRFPGKVATGIFGGHDWPSHYGVRARHWRPLPEPPAQPEVNQS